MYYFHLKNVPDPITSDGYKWLDELPIKCHVDIPRKYFSGVYIDWLLQYNINLWNGEVFSMPPNYQLPIHVDATEFSDKGKMNWSYCGGENYSTWYEPNANWKNTSEALIQDDGKLDDYAFCFTNEEVTEVARTTVVNPTVINSGQAHSVLTTTHPRKSISISMIYKDFTPPHKDWGIPIGDLKEIFKDHVL